MLLARLTMGSYRGAADSGFFHFYASRNPHDSKSLDGLRGRKHRLILTLIASRSACLLGTDVDVGDSGGRPPRHRNNSSVKRTLVPAQDAEDGRGRAKCVAPPWGNYA